MTETIHMRIHPTICRTAQAARHVKSRAAELRKHARVGPGVRITNATTGKTATFLGDHPDPDYWGDEWWEIGG